jgi:hypothetical protein
VVLPPVVPQPVVVLPLVVPRTPEAIPPIPIRRIAPASRAIKHFGPLPSREGAEVFVRQRV